MTSRRRRDILIALAVAVVVVVAGAVVWLTSDARATTSQVGEPLSAPVAMSAAPGTLSPSWTKQVSATATVLPSPYGTVVVADGHTVIGYDAVSGDQRWLYERSNLPICAVGSGDSARYEESKAGDTEPVGVQPAGIKSGGAVRGILVAYEKNGKCSEITLLNSATGARLDQHTVAVTAPAALVFGGPYAGLFTGDLADLFRNDLVRTAIYGNQPTPRKPNTRHLGCLFTDAAIATSQFATIEHCDNNPASAVLVMTYADPKSTETGEEKKWENDRFESRATVTLDAAEAKLVGLNADTAAVLVAEPEPAVVGYDAKGALTFRAQVDLTAEQIIAAAAAGFAADVRVFDDARYTLLGDTLLAVGGRKVDEIWTLTGALGMPAVVGEDLLVPMADGVAVVSSETGEVTRTIPVDRGGYTGPVQIGTVGSMVVETRGTEVVALQ